MPSTALLFPKLRWHLARNGWALIVAHSWWRFATILYVCSIIWIVLFSLSWYGFHELKTRWDIKIQQMLIETVFDLFFFSLMILLTISTSIILYSSLFASTESQFLLSGPVPDDQVFAYKFQGAVAFSSWAFILLGSPVLLSYGVEVGAPWYYYIALPMFFVGYLLLPGSIGALACLFIVNVLPRHRKHFLIGFGVAALVGLAFWGYEWYVEAKEFGVGSRAWFESFLDQLTVLGSRLVPFHWMSAGIKAAAVRRPETMAYNLGLVWSYGLFAYLVTVWLARKLYRRGFNRLASGGTLRKKYGGHWMDHLLSGAVFFLDAQTKLLIVKDFRSFRRDFAQWAQIILFLGMGCIYFVAMRNFYEGDIGRSFKIGISMLTLIATSFLMCAYTGRFIFPMLSLEGSKFWILGLLPLDRGRLMIGKFAFSSLGCVIAGEFLIVFSNLMLGMPWLIMVTHMVTIALMAFAFSGLSVGMGAMMPNFRETDPSKIAVGFGGTVNLVVGLLLLAVVVVMVPGPIQFLHGRDPDTVVPLSSVPILVWLCMLAGVGIGVLATWLPMRAGMQNLRRLEF